ncbi:MAG: hypoxanthine phosphoribosyltransferase [Bacteroidetes bacterium]|nr:hypoxanthine phosphoribosyltransferase [Bacteroidota bacterium]
MQIHDKNFEIFITADEIQSTIKKLAGLINLDYSDKELVLVIILKGAFIFAADLVRSLNFQSQIELLSAKSYGKEITSSGNVEISLPNLNIKGKHVLIIEDIVDTGLTLSSVKSALNKFGPLSIEITTLISKPAMRKIEIDVKYIGIEIPPVFIVGFGLDYAEHGRNLPDIYAITS